MLNGEKIVLIDGHSILNRAFYALPLLSNSEGIYTNAIYGFLNILFKILDEEKPGYLTVAFDVHAPTFRHAIYKEYKGTRKPMPDELKQQVPLLKEVLKAMDILILEQAGLEADDILGTVSKRCEMEGMDVSIISGDRDLLQLATDKVRIRIPKTRQGNTEVEDYYAADVEAKYGTTPGEFIDLKALMGDASDNIPGVPSIGEKTAIKIIKAFGSIENAHKHVQEVTPARASSALRDHYDMAVMSKTLATINVDAGLEYNPEDARINNLYTKEAYEYFQRLQFKNLLPRFGIMRNENKTEDLFKKITCRRDADTVFEKAAGEKTAGISFYREKGDTLPLFENESGISGIGLAFGKNDVYVITTQSDITVKYLMENIARLSKTVRTLSIFHLKEALLEFNSLNPESCIPEIKESSCFDGIIAAYLLNPLKNDYEYPDIAREQLGILTDEREDELLRCFHEAYTAYACHKPLMEKLRDSGMEKLFLEIEMPLVFILYDMEKNGVKIDASSLRSYGEKLKSQIVILEKQIYGMTGETFNIQSPKQLGTVLFEHMHLPNGKKTKTGYSTSADILEKLAPDYPVVSKILEYRQLTKLKSTYADGLMSYVRKDGRIHGKFNQTVTATGRLSSAEPNLQNIPIRMELGRLIRKVFVPEDGYVFIDADYSQIELRILAHLSGDEELISAYKEEKDIHRMTASQVFNVPFDEVTDSMRRNAKAVNFGIVYGMSSFGLSQDLSISRKEAAEYIDNYFHTYPGIKAYLEGAVAFAKKNGYVTTLYGRRRPIPELTASNPMQRSFGERVAMNSPIQGTAADIMKIAMIRVSGRMKKEKLESRIVLQIHDELLIEAKKSEIDTVKEILAGEMEHSADLLVPLSVEMNTGTTWYEAK